MRRFIDEIVINNTELVTPIVSGIEATGDLEVELYEKDRFDLNNNRHIPGEKTVILKVFRKEHI